MYNRRLPLPRWLSLFAGRLRLYGRWWVARGWDSPRAWRSIAIVVAVLALLLALFRQPLANLLWPETKIQQLLDDGQRALRQGRLTAADGSGARMAATASSYAAWLFVCDAAWALALCVIFRGPGSLPVLARDWKTGLFTGVLSGAAYWIAMWAMTKAPIASVAALRETSILFAMMISVFALGEKMTGWRGAAALSIVAGVIALRMG